jgi:hypothetical protein
MDHRYIDENGVAQRYLEHTLAPDEQEAFEAHVVDCEECADRLLLAQIFLERRAADATPSAPVPKRAEFVAGLSPWRLLLLATVAALLLLAVPTAYFLLELARLSGRR